MDALVIQNCATEDIGLYETCLQDYDIKYRVYHAYVGKAFPSADCLMLSSSAAQRVLGGWAKVSCTKTLEWLYEEDSDFLLAAGVRVCLIILGL